VAEQLTPFDPGIDQLLIADHWTQGALPGRPSLATALSIAGLGVALALSTRRQVVLLHPVVLLLLGTSWFALLCSVFKLRALEAIPGFSSLSVPTALSLFGLALGTAALHPSGGIIRLVTSPGSAGASARLLLPSVALLPILVGWVVIQGERRGVIGTEAGLAIFSTVMGVVLVVLSLRIARSLELLDASRDEAARLLGRELERTKIALDRATAYLESAPGAMLVTDVGHRVALANDEAERVFGMPRAELVGTPVEALLADSPADRPRGGAALFRAGANPAREIETHSRMLPTPEGAVTILAVRDVTAQRKAEAALAASERRFRGIFDSAFQFVGLLSPDGILLEANRTALDFAAQTPGEVIGKPFWEARWWSYARDVQERLRDAIRAAASGEFVRYETVVRGAGERSATIDFSLKPIRDESGAIVLLIPEGRDITERRVAEERLRASLEDKEVLLREVHHRVKNNLQVIASLLRLHSERIADPEARTAFEDSQDRVRSIALLHEKLCRSESLASVNVAEYARDLTTALLRARGADAGRLVQVVVTGDDVTLPLDRALPFGLILNELVTNSLKHGLTEAIARPEIRIEVARRGDEVELVVSDNGIGLPPEFGAGGPWRIGIELVRTLSRQLDASLAFESRGGARCTLRFPAPAAPEPRDRTEAAA